MAHVFDVRLKAFELTYVFRGCDLADGKFLMRAIKISALVVIAFLVVIPCLMFASTTSGTWRYKMTVVVETPEGIKSGFAVREMSNSRSKFEIDLPQVVHPAKIKGEAVAVDLGDRGVLFALLTGGRYGPDYARTILFDVFPSGQGGNSVEGIKYYRKLSGVKEVLSPVQYPTLVMFRDINDPKSVTRVMSTDGGWGYVRSEKIKTREDRFEELFGKGVRLREITLEMTDEPVTWGVQKWFPWFFDFYSKQFDGQRYNTIDSDYPFANVLNSGAFSTGEKYNDN